MTARISTRPILALALLVSACGASSKSGGNIVVLESSCVQVGAGSGVATFSASGFSASAGDIVLGMSTCGPFTLSCPAGSSMSDCAPIPCPSQTNCEGGGIGAVIEPDGGSFVVPCGKGTSGFSTSGEQVMGTGFCFPSKVFLQVLE